MSVSAREIRDAVRKAFGAVAIAALVTAMSGCSADQSSLAAGPTNVAVASSAKLNMSASAWNFQYSPNMPSHPTAAGSGWQFAFPTQRGVAYLTTAQRPPSASEWIKATISIDTVGNPFFEFRTDASNTCDGTATVRLYFQRRGDDMSGNGDFQYYRWWSHPVAYELSSGRVDLVGNLADPSAWSSVLGKSGASNESGFRAALADIGSVGFTFGGGCFFAHGVYVAPGTGQAVFSASTFEIR